MRTEKALIRLRIRAVWSVPSLFVDVLYSIHWICKQIAESWLDCADAQADLGHRWPLIAKGPFSFVVYRICLYFTVITLYLSNINSLPTFKNVNKTTHVHLASCLKVVTCIWVANNRDQFISISGLHRLSRHVCPNTRGKCGNINSDK